MKDNKIRLVSLSAQTSPPIDVGAVTKLTEQHTTAPPPTPDLPSTRSHRTVRDPPLFVSPSCAVSSDLA